MTNTVIIDTRVRRTSTVRRPVVLPRLKTFMGQAIAGSVFSHFVLLLLACLTATDQLGFWLIALPFFLFLSLFGGVPAGFIIWACTRSDARPIRPAYRCLIALLVLFPGWFYLSWIAFVTSATGKLWLLAWLLLPAITIGSLTHSRLRVGRELVRGGEAVRLASRVLAGFSGFVLRFTVVLLFMESFVATIYLTSADDPQGYLIWAMLLCGHFAASLLVVFVRTEIQPLAIIASIALAPLVIAFITFPVATGALRYVFAGYIGLWVMFVLTRSRQTDVALAFLNEEIHYYLID